MKSVCIYCGANPGARAAYAEGARLLGETMARHGLRMIYGGGRAGMMGAVADALMVSGGEVIGVIPQHLVDRELAHHGVTDLRVVESMHERKALMADLADAFIALPGGVGTLEELLEIMTWANLGLHHKPCGLLNIEGYYDGLCAFLDHTVAEGFVAPTTRALLVVEHDPDALLRRMELHVDFPGAV
jgi:uncharacterized protein (TIGR00730 family)